MRKLWPLLLLLAACGTQDPTGVGVEPLRLTATSLPPAYLGENYAYAFSAEGGVRPYRFALEGRLPQGLTFQGGRVSGVPKEKGQFPLILTVEDGAKNSRTARLTLTVSDPPPPRLALVQPPAQVEGPFLLLGRVEVREALGFQLEVVLKDLSPDLSGFKGASPVYLLDYDPESWPPAPGHGLLQAPQGPGGLPPPPHSQLSPSPPGSPPSMVLYDKEGKPLGQALARGKPFADLLAAGPEAGARRGRSSKETWTATARWGKADLRLLAEGYFPKAKPLPQESKPEPGAGEGQAP
jgi:hypothetical protein